MRSLQGSYAKIILPFKVLLGLLRYPLFIDQQTRRTSESLGREARPARP